MSRHLLFRVLLWVFFSASAVMLGVCHLILAFYYGSHSWYLYLFPDEPGVQRIADLSAATPQVRLPDLLEENWDYVCILYPYYPVALDPKLAGVEVPWINSDGLYTIVLKRGAEYDVQRMNRGRVVYFQYSGLPDGEACYDSIDVVLEYVEGAGPITVRVSPGN